MSDGLLLAVIVGLAAVALGVWLWGGLAGLLFGDGWPRVPAGQLLDVLARLPGRVSDPAAAWPRAARAGLPGAVEFYSVLGAMLAGAAAGAVWLARLVRFGRPGHGARWAGAAQLRALHGSARTGRLTLGRYRGRLLHAEQRHALIAFGPPQSGKSAGLAVPALLEWEGPAIASSIKTDLLASTVTRRRALGEVFVFDPFGLAVPESHTWSPLRAAGTWDGALECAWRLAAAGELDQRGVEGGDFWAIAAEQRLAPLLFTASVSGLGMDAVVRWAYGQGGRELDEAIARITGEARDTDQLEGAHAAYDALRAFERQADRTRTSIEATAQGLLRAYRFTRVLRSAAACQIVPDALLSSCNTLYLIGDAKASKLLRPIFLALAVGDRRSGLRAGDSGRRPARPAAVAVPRRGRERGAAAQPGRDRLDRAQPQHPAGLDLP